jgi:hypothetical protein
MALAATGASTGAATANGEVGEFCESSYIYIYIYIC